MEQKMRTHEQSLLTVLNQLKDAIDEEKWQRAEELDREIKRGLESAISSSSTPEDKQNLVELMTRIQSLYSLLISHSEAARAKVSEELKKLSKDKKAVNFYLKSSQYR